MSEVTLAQPSGASDMADVRTLCWAYRDFLLNHTEVDRQITEIFYPVDKYQTLMDRLEHVHARPGGVILLARDANGVAVGCGMAHELEPGTSEIKRVFVSDAARGKGVARALCRALIEQARVDGFARVVLDTSKSLTAAQTLYSKLGFSQRGPYQPIPDDVLPELVFYEFDLKQEQP
ncbi:MAG: GNAT family N-acetyltransferase [Sulfitobacter sp.]